MREVGAASVVRGAKGQPESDLLGSSSSYERRIRIFGRCSER